MYKYLVCYNFKTSDGMLGTGDIQMTFMNELESEDLKDLRQYIANDTKKIHKKEQIEVSITFTSIFPLKG